LGRSEGKLSKTREKIPLAPARKKYSGQFNVRIDRRLHRALAIEAAKAGISLNAMISQKLAKKDLGSKNY
jgi:predicted HicB family RNase H-like nuclease